MEAYILRHRGKYMRRRKSLAEGHCRFFGKVEFRCVISAVSVPTKLGLPDTKARLPQADAELDLHVAGRFVCLGVVGLIQVWQ